MMQSHIRGLYSQSQFAHFSPSPPPLQLSEPHQPVSRFPPPVSTNRRRGQRSSDVEQLLVQPAILLMIQKFRETTTNHHGMYKNPWFFNGISTATRKQISTVKVIAGFLVAIDFSDHFPFLWSCESQPVGSSCSTAPPQCQDLRSY